MTTTLTTTVDGAEARVVNGEPTLPIQDHQPSLDEAMERLADAQREYSSAKAAATEANAEKRAAQETLNLRVAEALEAHAREHDPQLRLGEDAVDRIRGAAVAEEPEDE